MASCQAETLTGLHVALILFSSGVVVVCFVSAKVQRLKGLLSRIKPPIPTPSPLARFACFLAAPASGTRRVSVCQSVCLYSLLVC